MIQKYSVAIASGIRRLILEFARSVPHAQTLTVPRHSDLSPYTGQMLLIVR